MESFKNKEIKSIVFFWCWYPNYLCVLEFTKVKRPQNSFLPHFIQNDVIFESIFQTLKKNEVFKNLFCVILLIFMEFVQGLLDLRGFWGKEKSA